MFSKARDGEVVVALSGKWVSWTHTIVAYAAFFGALVTGLYLHYHKIVQNEYYGYPDEWFPSVSATIGDRYPERSIFQLLIAMTSGPRFALVFLWYVLTARSDSVLPKFVAGTGVFRTLTCGGWTYITSTDDHDWHDIFMISYLVATLPWTLGCIGLSPNSNPKALKYRKILAGSFFATLIPLIYFFIQHKVHKTAGAYTTYAFFEWALILLDVGFDAVTTLEFEGFELVVRDVKGSSRGDQSWVAHAVLEEEKDKPFGQIFAFGFSWPEAFDATAEVYNGYVFWSMLTSLGLTVWYFPLWHMGISGYEVMVMCTISPFLLCSASLRLIIMRNIRYIHLLSLSGLLAYLVRAPELRLFAVGFGVSMSCLAWSATWFGERSQAVRTEERALAWTVGLLVSSLAKFAFYTNNPIWPIVHAENGGWNKLGFALAVAAIIRSTRPATANRGELSPTGSLQGSILAGFSLGGLLFGMHSLLSDSSTMVLWVWEGLPVRGPIPANGVVTLLAMGGGAISFIWLQGNGPGWIAFAVLGVGAFLLTNFSHWTGYLGALMMATQLVSLAPPLITSAARFGPRALGLGFLVYNVLVLAHVWVVAYAFVPGGPLLREHTDWIMVATVLLLGVGVYNIPKARSHAQQQQRPNKRVFTRSKSYYVYILMALELMAISISYLRFPTNDYVPYHGEDKVITAGIWTIHFSLDNDMWSSERRIRDLIKELEVDVVGLLETDLQRIIMGNRDTTQFIAEDLGMYVDAGPGPNKHTWGAALLSKFPILNSTHHLLPSPIGELAPAIHATIDAYGEYVDVVVFHSGQEEDPEDRRLQSEYLAELMRDSPRPLILLSYLVIEPQKGNYNTYVGEKSGMKDIDPSDWDRWCEYILYKGIKRSGYARVSRSTITDTEFQVGKFIVGQPEGSDEQISEDQVVEGLRFPARFRNQGVRGHRYHVFEEPRYYS